MGDIFDLVRIASEKTSFLNAEQEKELIIKAQKGDIKSSEMLFCANSRFILKQAKGFAQNYELPLEDVFSSACEGFLKAIEKFDLKKENRLITLASWWIKSAVQNQLYKEHTIKIPHNQLNFLKSENRENYNDLKMALLLNACGSITSLDTPIGNEEDSECLYDTLSGSYGNPQEEYEISEVRKIIESVMKENLNDREIYVLKMAFGFIDGETHSLSEIGQLLGCSKQRAEQIKKAALLKLRHPRVFYQLKDLVA